MSLLLIDSRVPDIPTVIAGLNENTKYVTFEFNVDTFDTLKTKIDEIGDLSFSNVGLFQHNYYMNEYQLLSCMTPATLIGLSDSLEPVSVQVADPSLNSWTDFSNFLDYLISKKCTKNFDMMACKIWTNDNWVYVIQTLETQLQEQYPGFEIRASSNDTGFGGDWILESDTVNLTTVYFTDLIEKWSFDLGTFNQHFGLIDINGNLWMAGYNNYGQLGLGNNVVSFYPYFVNTGVTNVAQVSCGQEYTMIIKKDGTLWGCGSNGTGQLGLNNTSNTFLFKQVFNVSTTGNYVVGGPIYAVQVTCLGGFTTAGQGGTLIIRNDYTLWISGNSSNLLVGINGAAPNYFYQIFANGITGSPVYALSMAAQGSLAAIIKPDSTLWVSGNSNQYGALGRGDTSNYGIFTQVFSNGSSGTPIYASQVSIGYQYGVSNSPAFMAVIKTDSTLWTCGYNNYAQLGLNHTNNCNTLQQVFSNGTSGTPVYASQVSCGDNHMLVIYPDNTVWSCGSNSNGQLGLGNTSTQYTLQSTGITNAKQVTAGQISSFLLRQDGSYYVCGNNNQYYFGAPGVIGYNNYFTKITFYNATNNVIPASNLYTVSGTLLSIPTLSGGTLHPYINGGAFPNAVYASPFGYTYYMTKTDGTFWGCGNNGSGQLGINNTTSFNGNQNTYTKISTDLSSNSLINLNGIFPGSNHCFIFNSNNNYKQDSTIFYCFIYKHDKHDKHDSSSFDARNDVLCS